MEGAALREVDLKVSLLQVPLPLVWQRYYSSLGVEPWHVFVCFSISLYDCNCYACFSHGFRDDQIGAACVRARIGKARLIERTQVPSYPQRWTYEGTVMYIDLQRNQQRSEDVSRNSSLWGTFRADGLRTSRQIRRYTFSRMRTARSRGAIAHS